MRRTLETQQPKEGLLQYNSFGITTTGRPSLIISVKLNFSLLYRSNGQAKRSWAAEMLQRKESREKVLWASTGPTQEWGTYLRLNLRHAVAWPLRERTQFIPGRSNLAHKPLQQRMDRNSMICEAGIKFSGQLDRAIWQVMGVS